MNKKKLLALLVSSAFLFAACGDDDSPSSPKNNQEEVSSSSEEDDCDSDECDEKSSSSKSNDKKSSDSKDNDKSSSSKKGDDKSSDSKDENLIPRTKRVLQVRQKMKSLLLPLRMMTSPLQALKNRNLRLLRTSRKALVLQSLQTSKRTFNSICSIRRSTFLPVASRALWRSAFLMKCGL